MRLTLCGQRSTVITAGVQVEVCEASENRVALILCPMPGGNGYYSILQGSGVGFGVLITTLGDPLTLNIWDHGDIVRKEWWGRHDVAGTSVANVFMIDLPPDWEKHFPEEKVEQYRRYF